jgi:hypothetical protein
LSTTLVGVLAGCLGLLLAGLLMLLGPLTALASPLLLAVPTALLRALTTSRLLPATTLLGAPGRLFRRQFHRKPLGEGHLAFAALGRRTQLNLGLLLAAATASTATASASATTTSSTATAAPPAAHAILERGTLVGDAARLQLDLLFVLVVGGRLGGQGRDRLGPRLLFLLLVRRAFALLVGQFQINVLIDVLINVLVDLLVAVLLFAVVFDGVVLLGAFAGLFFDGAGRLGQFTGAGFLVEL